MEGIAKAKKVLSVVWMKLVVILVLNRLDVFMWTVSKNELWFLVLVWPFAPVAKVHTHTLHNVPFIESNYMQPNVWISNEFPKWKRKWCEWDLCNIYSHKCPPLIKKLRLKWNFPFAVFDGGGVGGGSGDSVGRSNRTLRITKFIAINIVRLCIREIRLRSYIC